MSFRYFISEAEWIGNQRYPTVEALWHILQPLVTSKTTLLALGNLPISKRKRFGKDDLPLPQGTRVHSPHGGVSDPNTLAIGVRTFLNRGLLGFEDSWDTQSSNRQVLHILQVNLKDVWTIDPKINEKNPWLLLKTHWEDLKHEFNKLWGDFRGKRFKDGNSQQIQSEWEGLSNRIERTYRVGLTNDENIMPHLQLFFHLVYVEAPRLLNFLKTGLSFGRYSSSTNFMDIDQESIPQAFDMHMPKSFKFDFKIISKTLPLTDTPWAIIIDPRAARTVNTVVIPDNFVGFRSAGTGAFHAPNARADIAEKFSRELDDKFREDLVPDLEHFLEMLAEHLDGMETEFKHLNKFIKGIEMSVKSLEKVLSKIEKIVPNFEFPVHMEEALDDFINQGLNILNARFEPAWDGSSTEDDGEIFQQSKDIAEEAFHKARNIVSRLTNR